MTLGPGKYDAVLMQALATIGEKNSRVKTGILIVFDVEGGSQSGFAAQLSAEDMVRVPGVLRSLALQIESDFALVNDSTERQTCTRCGDAHDRGVMTPFLDDTWLCAGCLPHTERDIEQEIATRKMRH